MTLTRQDLSSLPRIHEGRSTIVYLQEKSEYGGPVVIKVLQPGYASHGGAGRPEVEFETTKGLNIPGIRKALKLVTIDSSPAVILSYVEGRVASDVFAEGLSLDDKLKIGVSLVTALDQLHRHKILHRNLTSANVIISGDMQATVIDLDMAVAGGHVGRQERLDLFETSLEYISPEQTGRINRPVDYRSDLYSAGVILYEMLTGKLPFDVAGKSELIHQLLAKNPVPPHEIESGLPETVSDIVLKLLAKSPEDRYQSAYGLKADLEEALARLRATGRIEPFPLGREDLSGIFKVPGKLYGREQETVELLRAIEAVAGGSSETVLITGPPGVGKTMLVTDIRRFVGKAGGSFISGKPDEYQKNTPYFALIQAFTELVDQMLTENVERVAYWKAKILQAVGSGGGLLVSLIPRLELIIGRQPPVPDLGPTEAQNRFRLIFLSFVRSIAEQGHPLVMFIDNLQWADPATMNLLKPLMAGQDYPYLLFIGAYRDVETGPAHQLSETIGELKSQKANVRVIRLGNLSGDAFNQLVSDTLRCDLSYSRPLSNLIFEKTGGNPLFAVQFFQSLYEEGYLTFDYDLRRWEWDADHIRRMGITDNVVVLAMQKIERLPEETRRLLSLAACIGALFDAGTLAAAAEMPVSEVVWHLWQAAEEGLILPVGEKFAPATGEVPMTGEERFEFLHDRVRKASRSLLPRRQQKLVHLKLGRLLLQKTPEAEFEDQIFSIVNHLDEGFQYLENASERLRLVELNLSAGRKAKREAAYHAAIWYFSMGIGMLPPDKWARYHNLALNLYMEAIEAEYLSLNFERAELLSKEVLQHTDDLLTRGRVYELRVLFYTAQKQDEEAIMAGLEALEMLGLRLPGEPDALKTCSEQLRPEIARAISRVEDLAYLPVMGEARQLTLMRVMMSLATPASKTNFPLLTVLISLMVLTSVKHGNSPMSAFAYGWYAVLLCGPYRDIETGYRFGQLSLRLQRQFQAREQEAKILFLFNAFVRPWSEDARASIKPLREVSETGMETGDLEYALASAVHYSGYLFCTGGSVSQIRDSAVSCLETMGRLRLELHSQLARIWGQAALNLAGEASDPGKLSGRLLDEQATLPAWAGAKDLLPVFCALYCKTRLLYLFGDYPGAAESARECEKYGMYGEGYLYYADFLFYFALVLLASYRKAGAGEKEALLEKAKFLLARLKHWASHSPVNFAHKCDLIEAELARTTGEIGRAMELYGRAIKGTSENGFVSEEALAYELEARFYLAMGRDDIAGVSIRKSVDCYRLWGAGRKVEDLESQFRYLLVRDRAASLDAAAIIAASRTLSQEIHLEQLLNKLTSIAIENAGAQKGVLIMARDASLVLQARGIIGQGQVETLSGIPFASSGEVPVSVVNYVARTQTPVVLNDAYHDSTYESDRYISEHHTRSLLCLPIVHHGALSGILYLENNLATNVFTQDRLELLKALSYQAAISIENAHVYDALRDSESRFRTLAETSSAGIVVYRQKILYANPATVRLSGYTMEELLSMDLVDIVHPDFRELVTERVMRRLKGEAVPTHYEYLMIRKDGETRWIDVSVTRFQYQGQPAGLGVLIDVTDRKRAEEGLKAAKSQVEMYLDLMSHDITNMNQIGIGFLEFALTTMQLDDSSRELISKPLEALQSSTRLIENVRKLQRVIEGGVRHYETDVDEVITDLVSTYSNLVGREIQINYTGCKCTVMANELLTDVFSNIIGNAIKHSLGQLIISIRMKKEMVEGKPCCIVSIEDNGPGIPDELKVRLFTRFQKGKTRTSGKGLGLYLVKVLVEDYGGKVWLEDCVAGEHHRGCRFMIQLPAVA